MSKKIDSKKILKSEEKRMAIQKEKELERSLARELNAFLEKEKKPNFPLTGICYKKLPGDKVIITDFYGFLTAQEIKEQYGEEIYNAYSSNLFSMCLEYNANGKERLMVYDPCVSEIITKGKVLSNENFANIRKVIKQCGNYLHELKIAMKSEEKVVGI